MSNVAAMEQRHHTRCACSSGFSAYRAGAKGDFVLRGTERVYERARPFRIDHIALDFDIAHDKGRIKVTAELHVERVDERATSLTLDAVGFEISRVQSRDPGRGKRWRAADYSYDDETLQVELTAPRAIVRVTYSAQPRRGMYFLKPDEAVPTRPEQLWTQCQDEDARYIFPCHDKPHVKQTMDIRAKVRPGWFVLSNGDLSNSKREQNTGRFHYKMRDKQPSYLFTLVAGDFAAIEDRVAKLPVTYYVPRGREKDGKRTFRKTPSMIRLFAKLTGVPYPWTKYAQVVVNDFIFGGMENTGATTMYEHILLDERAAIDVDSDYLIAHELAHQWFGDLVTCRDWSQAWLNEGFATFMEHIWREHDLGSDDYFHGVRGDVNAWLGETSSRYQRPVVCQDYEAPIDIFDRHLYEKGACILHGLRMELGDGVFWRGVSRYLKAHASGVVETRDLQRALEAESGRSLEQYFEQYLYRADYPRLDVDVRYGSGMLTVTVKQRLDTGVKPFALDLDIDVAPQKGRSRRLTRKVRRAQETFTFSLAERPRFAVIDPDLRIIGRVEVKAPADMWRAQLTSAPTGRARVLAASALAKRDEPATIAALGEVLRKRNVFWGARAGAAAALGRIASEEALEALRTAARTGNHKVRRAVAAALGNFKSKAAAQVLTRMAKSDESLLVAAAACRALGDTRQPGVKETLVSVIDQPSWADTLRAGALGGLARLRDETAVDLALDRTRYGIPDRARRAAIAALPLLSTDRKTRECLEDLLSDADPHVKIWVVDALAELGDVKGRGALVRQLERERDGRVRRRIREALRDLTDKGQRETRRLREQLDEMRRDHKELQVRMSKLEARLKD